jgi:hypothetical protein
LPCTACGFDPSAGIVRRHTPEQTRGLTAVAMKFGTKWSFGAAALMVVVSFIYFDDITTAEEQGGTFTIDPFSGLLYDLAGKWAVIGFLMVFAVIFVAAGFRALSLKRSGQLE